MEKNNADSEIGIPEVGETETYVGQSVSVNYESEPYPGYIPDEKEFFFSSKVPESNSQWQMLQIWAFRERCPQGFLQDFTFWGGELKDFGGDLKDFGGE